MHDVPSIEEIDVEISRRRCADLRSFVEEAWPIVEPGNAFVPGWHIDLICAELMRWRETRDLMITIPPGCMKSLLVSVFFPAWVWTFDPGHRFIGASYVPSISLRDAGKSLDILRSPWYTARWGNLLHGGPIAVGNYGNLQGGWRLSTSVGGMATGFHAHTHLYDDLVKPLELSDTTLAVAKRWVRETMPTRFADLKRANRILIMQRLHENDPAGELSKDGTFRIVRLPMRAEDERCRGDPRKPGELLWPQRIGEEELSRLEKQIGGARAISAQLQQRPAPEAGNLFQRAWFRTYTETPKFDVVVQSWDLAFKDAEDNDYVAGVLLGRKGHDYYLIDLLLQRLSFPATLACIRAKAKDPVWGKASVKLIEDKANGPAVIATLEKEISGILAVTPEGGKVARANAVAPIVETGHFFVPAFASWVDGYILSLCGFPFMAHDDDVDATTQGLLYMHARANRFHEAMQKLRKT